MVWQPRRVAITAEGGSMLRIKSGVRLTGVKPELVIGIIRVLGVFESYDIDMWLTSVVDGVHREGSRHYAGEAFDIRTTHLATKTKANILRAVRAALGGTEFRLYDEAQTKQPHWHISWHASEGGASSPPG